MAITKTMSNAYKEYLRDPFESNMYKFILMGASFVFDADVHANLSDVTANQIATGYGYTQDNIELSGLVLTTVAGVAIATWNTVTLTASGGNIGPFGGGIVYDFTQSGLIVASIDLGMDETIIESQSYQFVSPNINIS